MNLIGKKVVHRKFGQGEISSIEDNRIEINFTTTIKTFLFPDVLEHWTVNTGYYLSGKSKGMPKIPQNIGISSCCILTDKEDGEPERKRIIAALMMPEDRFIGKECKDGLITAHENYRIIWNESYSPLLIWNYFPEELRPKSWGGAEVKYTSKIIAKIILEDMAAQADGEEKDKISDFQRYFCKINNC